MRLEVYRLAGRDIKGAGAKRRRSRTGFKVQGESGWVSVYCWSALLSAGVTLAPPSRGQYWRLTGLVWHIWVEVKVEATRSRSSSSSRCKLVKALSTVTHS